VLHRTYDEQNCSIARSLELIGERWTILIIRDVFLCLRRFDDIQRDLGVSRGILSDRLDRLIESGILERRLYQERPERYEYRLTDKGRDLWPITIGLLKWGDRYYAENGPPRVILHRGCGGEVTERLRCAKCGADLTARDVEARPGPGAKAAAA
jgi:DNA-binding HxlR family transcriptional regulator